MKKFDFSVIRNLRMKLGLTTEELARRANMTRATIANLESGQCNPTIETIDALSNSFQLSASELVRLAEVAKCEAGQSKRFKKGSFTGRYIRFPNFEIYHLKAKKGARKESDPKHHEDTAEVCLVLSGKMNVVVGGISYELGQSMALRFKALQNHHIDIIEDCEFLLIHHSLV